MPRRIAIVMGALSDFRVPFYELLRTRLEALDIDLALYYGNEELWSRHLAWATPFPVWRLPFGTTWYPVLFRLLKTSDLVIAEDASRRLINYFLLGARYFGGPKLMVWGHGWNHQKDHPRSVPERLKRFVSRRADGFLAYTPGVRQGLIDAGYDGRRIFNVQNAIAPPASRPRLEDVDQIRRQLGVKRDSRVVFFCGKMYPMRCLDVLVEAACTLRSRISNFHLVMAGNGPSERIAKEAAARHDFIHYVGPVFGVEKSAYFALADAYVLPGAVGLGVVDAFQHDVIPIVTRQPFHGPEIEYLVHEKNGIMTEPDAHAIAAGIERVLIDPELHDRLLEGCRAASAKITIEEMVDRFAQGVCATLDSSLYSVGVSYE